MKKVAVVFALIGAIAALVGVFVTGVYGGYFGAAQGILLLAILGLALEETLQRINAVKNVLAGLANLLAGIIFAIVAPVSWPVVGLIAAGSLAGGTLGAMLPPSTVLAVYAILTQQDIGKLFMAGILPGLLAMAMYVMTIALNMLVAMPIINVSAKPWTGPVPN